MYSPVFKDGKNDIIAIAVAYRLIQSGEGDLAQKKLRAVAVSWSIWFLDK